MSISPMNEEAQTEEKCGEEGERGRTQSSSSLSEKVSEATDTKSGNVATEKSEKSSDEKNKKLKSAQSSRECNRNSDASPSPCLSSAVASTDVTSSSGENSQTDTPSSTKSNNSGSSCSPSKKQRPTAKRLKLRLNRKVKASNGVDSDSRAESTEPVTIVATEIQPSRKRKRAEAESESESVSLQSSCVTSVSVSGSPPTKRIHSAAKKIAGLAIGEDGINNVSVGGSSSLSSSKGKTPKLRRSERLRKANLNNSTPMMFGDDMLLFDDEFDDPPSLAVTKRSKRKRGRSSASSSTSSLSGLMRSSMNAGSSSMKKKKEELVPTPPHLRLAKVEGYTLIHDYEFSRDEDELRQILTTSKTARCDGSLCCDLKNLGPYSLAKESWDSVCPDRAARVECSDLCGCDPTLCQNRSISLKKEMKLGSDVSEQSVYGVDQYTFDHGLTQMLPKNFELKYLQFVWKLNAEQSGYLLKPKKDGMKQEKSDDCDDAAVAAAEGDVVSSSSMMMMDVDVNGGSNNEDVMMDESENKNKNAFENTTDDSVSLVNTNTTVKKYDVRRLTKDQWLEMRLMPAINAYEQYSEKEPLVVSRKLVKIEDNNSMDYAPFIMTDVMRMMVHRFENQSDSLIQFVIPHFIEQLNVIKQQNNDDDNNEEMMQLEFPLLSDYDPKILAERFIEFEKQVISYSLERILRLIDYCEEYGCRDLSSVKINQSLRDRNLPEFMLDDCSDEWIAFSLSLNFEYFYTKYNDSIDSWNDRAASLAAEAVAAAAEEEAERDAKSSTSDAHSQSKSRKSVKIASEQSPSAQPSSGFDLSTERQICDAHLAVFAKGTGVVCQRMSGILANEFVVPFYGVVYPSWFWYEKDDRIKYYEKRQNAQKQLDFFNLVLERHSDDPSGLGQLVIDPSKRGNYASRLSHSCNPNCIAISMVTNGGMLKVGVYATRRIRFGEELTFNYNSVTEDESEWKKAFCLCGTSICQGYYLSYVGTKQYCEVLKNEHHFLHRTASMFHCAVPSSHHHYQNVAEKLDIDGSVMSSSSAAKKKTDGDGTLALLPFKKGVSTKKSKGLIKMRSNEECNDYLNQSEIDILNRNNLKGRIMNWAPLWLRKYCASILEYIEMEQSMLPSALKLTDYGKDMTEMEGIDSAVGLKQQRLQNLLITLNKMEYYFLSQSKNASKMDSAPIAHLNDLHMIKHIWCNLKEGIIPTLKTLGFPILMKQKQQLLLVLQDSTISDDNNNSQNTTKIVSDNIDHLILRCKQMDIEMHNLLNNGKNNKDNTTEQLRMKSNNNLMELADLLRNIPSTENGYYHAAADLLDMYAHTRYFFTGHNYSSFESHIFKLSDLGYIGPGKASAKRYRTQYVWGQLNFWERQTIESPDASLSAQRRGTIALPAMSCCFAAKRKYGSTERKAMLDWIEHKAENPWPTKWHWSFRNGKIYGSPWLDGFIDSKMKPNFSALIDRLKAVRVYYPGMEQAISIVDPG